MLNLNDAIYGLRNLIVGDDEESRIEDYVDSELAEAGLNMVEPAELFAQVRALVVQGAYVQAYELAIVPVLAKHTRDEVFTAARDFAVDFLRDDEPEEGYDVNEDVRELIEDIMQEYDRLQPLPLLDADTTE